MFCFGNKEVGLGLLVKTVMLDDCAGLSNHHCMLLY